MKIRPAAFSILGFFVLLQNAWAARVYRSGYKQDVQVLTSPYICLAGGGPDENWGLGWKGLLQNAAGGDALIIRADGRRGGYESWLLEDSDHLGFTKINSVTTLVLESSRDSNREDLVALVKKSELIFFAGGDQAIYVDWLKGSKLLSALNEALNERKVPVGGSSAGMAILTGLDYTPRYAKGEDPDVLLRTPKVLQNPTSPFIDIRPELLTAPYTQNLVPDTHFNERDRMGRLVGFMARALYNNPRLSFDQIKGIGVDQSTAYCYDAQGVGRVFGTGSVYFLKGHAPVEQIHKDQPLHWEGLEDAIEVSKVSATDGENSFNILTWTTDRGTSQYWWVDVERGFLARPR